MALYSNIVLLWVRVQGTCNGNKKTDELVPNSVNFIVVHMDPFGEIPLSACKHRIDALLIYKAQQELASLDTSKTRFQLTRPKLRKLNAAISRHLESSNANIVVVVKT